MINRIRLALLPIALLLAGCSSETANLTTTSGSSAAMVDNSANIAASQTVTATTVPANETVDAVVGNAVTLTLPASASGTVFAKFQNTLSMQLAKDQSQLVTYGQDLGVMAQTLLPKIVALAGNASAITTLLSDTASTWGLKPITLGQHSTLSNIASIITKVASSASQAETAITGIQTTGAVPSTASIALPPFNYESTLVAKE